MSTKKEIEGLEKRFKPNFTPYQIMKEGAFLDQGGYWRPIYSRVLGREVKNDYKLYNWGDLPLDKLICIDSQGNLYQDPTRNKYGVKCGLSLMEWEDHGWIYPECPRGWFEWYTRYYSGERSKYDAYQIKRWLSVKNRFGKLKNKSNTVKQTLLQWAIDCKD